MERGELAHMELNVFEKPHRENNPEMKGAWAAVEKDSKAKHYLRR